MRSTASGLLVVVLGVAGAAHGGERALTIDAIFGGTPLEGRLPREVRWLPGGGDFSWLAVEGEAPNAPAELWLEHAASGERRRLLADATLPSFGDGDAAVRPSLRGYRWAPGGDALLLQGDGELFVVALPGGETRRLTATAAAEEKAQLSPDGRWVAYVRDHDLWATELASGREVRLTDSGGPDRQNGALDWVYDEELGGRGGTPGFVWSPDSRAVLFLGLDERHVPSFPIVDLLPTHPEITWQRYPKAGDPNPIPSLSVVRLPAAGEPARVTLTLEFSAEDPPYIPRFGWLPGGTAFWYQRLDRAQRTLDLVRVAWPSGEATTLLTERDAAWINLHDDLTFLADGRFVWSSEAGGHRHLALHAADGAVLRPLTSGDWDVVHVEAVDLASGAMYFTANREHPTTRDLYRVGLGGGAEVVRITRETGTHDATVAPGGAWSIDTYSALDRPESMRVLDAGGSVVRELPHVVPPTVGEYALGAAEIAEVDDGAGPTLFASILRPADFDPARRYPVLVHVYGGPHAQVVRDAWGGRNRLFHHFVANSGVVVLAVDNRGSFGRGREFERAIGGRLGAVELEDQLRGLAWLRRQPWVDGERVAIWGWSYGGFMTCYALANAPEVFKAGAAVAPVTDWRYYDSIYTERYLGRPADNPDGYRDSSPAHRAESVRGFLLLAHGTGDDNVHWQSTAAMADGLYRAGKPYDLQLYPNLAHGIRGRGAHAHLYRRIAENLLYFLKP